MIKTNNMFYDSNIPTGYTDPANEPEYDEDYDGRLYGSDDYEMDR